MPGVLLVEDDEQLRKLLKRLLTVSGYEVWEAQNGKGVGAMYEAHHPDLVITDVVMPEKEGLEVIMDLRRRDQKVKIITMSGGGQIDGEAYLLIARKLGVQHTLSKPFSNADFLNVVRLALESED